MRKRGQTAGMGLTELSTDELKKLLGHLHRGELPCPVRADTLACVGFQSRSEPLLNALRNLDEASVRAVLVSVLAERRSRQTVDTPRVPDVPRHAQIVNERQVPSAPLERDGVVRLERRSLGQAAGGQQLGCSRVELKAGQRSWPFHAHHGNEEAIYVLSGQPLLRLGSQMIELYPGDYVALPAGDGSPHQMINRADGPATYLVLSTMHTPDVMTYPDSGRIGVMAGSAPGGDRSQRSVAGFFLRSSAVEYWEDEP
ncbi:MAG: cupin domain-containing protein [Myxococcota bacterium]